MRIFLFQQTPIDMPTLFEPHVCFYQIHEKYAVLPLVIIENLMIEKLGWNRDSFAIAKITYSDNIETIVFDVPTDIDYTLDLEDQIEEILDQKLEELGFGELIDGRNT